MTTEFKYLQIISDLRKMSASNKSPRDCIDEAADAMVELIDTKQSGISELMLVIERLEKDRNAMTEYAAKLKLELEGERMNYRHAMSINDSHLKVLHEAAMELHDLREELNEVVNVRDALSAELNKQTSSHAVLLAPDFDKWWIANRYELEGVTKIDTAKVAWYAALEAEPNSKCYCDHNEHCSVCVPELWITRSDASKVMLDTAALEAEPQEPVQDGVYRAPCPFCGSRDLSIVEGNTFRWRKVQCNCCGADGPEVRIQTIGSGTNEEWEQSALIDAVTEWNRRPNASPQADRDGERYRFVRTMNPRQFQELYMRCREQL